MVDDPNYLRHIAKLPDVKASDIAAYFNVEFGYVEKEASTERFSADDFTYLGLFVVDGYEALYWAVRGQTVYATAQPYADSYILLMATAPPPTGTS